MPTCSGGWAGLWLARQVLPDDERAAIERHLRELDRLGEDLGVLDREIAQAAIDDPAVKRLLTITGVNLIVAAGLVAAIGDVRRFPDPQKLVSYVGLNPRVRQSGLGLAQHGRISKQGRSHARAMLVEAAWAAAKAPGPLRAFFLRIRARRGHQIAAVAVARKLAVLCWHLLTKDADYHWARPALVANKLRAMELQAGQPVRKGNKRGAGLRVQYQRAAGSRDRARPSCRTSLRAICRQLAAARHCKSSARAPQMRNDDKAAWPGLHPRSRLFATRSPVPGKDNRSRQKGLSISSVVRADFHWLGGKRVKANSRSPASSRLSATARHFSRHLRRNALRRCLDLLRARGVDHVRVVGRDLLVQRLRRVGQQIPVLVDGAPLRGHVGPQRGQRPLQPGARRR